MVFYAFSHHLRDPSSTLKIFAFYFTQDYDRDGKPIPIQIKAKAELGIKVWCCNRALSGYSPADVAVGALLNACDHHELPEDFIDFVPPFMLTTAARDWSEHLKAFISEHVHPSKKVSQGG